MQEFITPPNHNHTHSDNHIFIVVDGEGTVYAADVKEVKELMKKVWDTQKAMLSQQPYIKQ